jgi:hypothetical protein
MRAPTRPANRASRYAIALLALIACQSESATLDLPAPQPLDVPAGAGAAQPHLAASDELLYLSWTEPADSGHALRFTTWNGAAWSPAVTVVAGQHWFVNWADFPSLVPAGPNTLLAHWLQRSGPGTYAYDVMMKRSSDRGVTWSEPFRPHTDGTATEHGFVSLFRFEDEAGAIWLDGRQFADSPAGPATKEMTVRFAAITAQGAGAEAALDLRACDCCQTTATLTSAGPLIAYRDRSPDEIRDIAVTRLVDGQWTEPRVVHADNWKIAGCPVNGPQADADGADVVLAWFAAANDSPRVQVAFSSDAGATFAAPVRVDGGDPVGRVDVLLLEEHALVVWLERAGDAAEVRARLVSRAGRLGEPRVVAAVQSSRASGFPRMARLGNDVILAWNEPGDPPRIRAARFTLD